MHYVYEVADFLPPMSVYDYIISQKKPEEIASYDTLIHPFDKYVWAFTFASTIGVMVTLILMKKFWNIKQGHSSYENDYYKGDKQKIQ